MPFHPRADLNTGWKQNSKNMKNKGGGREGRGNWEESQPEKETDSTEPRRLSERPARRRCARRDSPGGESPKPVGGEESGVSGSRGALQRSSVLQASWCWTSRFTALALSAKAAKSRALLFLQHCKGGHVSAYSR